MSTKNAVAVTADVVIIGGGIQGLVLQRELAAAGYACVLVTNAPIGAGQTLHSHGSLDSGTGLVTGALSQTLLAVTVPYLQRLGVPVRAADPSFLVVPEPMLDLLRPAWEAYDYRPEPASPSTVPGFEPNAKPLRVHASNVDKRRLVRALATGLESRVIGGEVVDASGRAVHVRATDDEEIRIRSGAIVIAAGCGTKRLLAETFGIGHRVTDRITYTKMHMICLRAPADVLPVIGAIVSPELFVAAHRGEGGTTWYATPVDPEPTVYDDAPADAVADVEPAAVAQKPASSPDWCNTLAHRDPRTGGHGHRQRRGR
ncbi:MAG: FAD-dependent oxidoreductase [Acidimicrobiales bacterium]